MNKLAIKETTTEADVERLIAMAYNRGREYFQEAGYKDWKQWWAGDPEEVESFIANDGDLYRFAAGLIDEADEDWSVGSLLKAYGSGELKGRYHRPTQLGPANIGPERPLSLTKPEPWSSVPRQELSEDEAKKIYSLAATRVTKKNITEVMDARTSLFLAANTDKSLADKLGIPRKDLDKQIRKYSGLTASAMQLEEKINVSVSPTGELEEINENYRWNGITNTSYLGRTVLDPDDMDQLFGKIHVEKEGEESGYFQGPGRVLRYYISQVALAIDTRMSYRDLEFKIGSFDRSTVRGMFNPGRKPTITVRRDSPYTVAHEMGHYLDNKFAKEFGSDNYYLSMASEINTKNEFYQKKYAHEYLRWAEKFQEFIDELMTRADIRSEYTQGRHETFARFISFFVSWTSKIATRRSIEQSSFADRFSDLDCRNWIRLMQEKSYLDANVIKLRRKASVMVEAYPVAPKEFSAALEKAKTVDRRVRFLSDYSLEEYASMKLFLTPDNQAGYAIKQDGDIVNLFNVSQIRGLGRQLVDQAIANGGTHLDAFEGKLTDLYRSKGFEEVRRVPFDPQYAPEGWSEEEGTPDIVYMQRPKTSTKSVSRAMMEGMHFARQAATASEADASAAVAMSGTRVQDVQNFKLNGPERIVGAVVITEDKVYPFEKRVWVDKHHANAAERAFASGAANDWDDFYFTDAFLTSRGELIDRFQSLLRFDVSESEQVYARSVMDALVKQARNLEHYTQRKLVTTDPVYHGEGISGNESKRKRNDPENWVDRTYFYLEGTEPEAAFVGMKKYKAALPPDAKIYDMAADPDGLSVDCRNSIGYLNLSCYEKKIKDMGYFGFQNTSSGVPNAIAIFYPLPVELADRLGSEQGEFNTHETESIEDPYPSGQHLIGEMELTLSFVKQAGSTENFLESIGASPEVIQFIMGQTPEILKRLVNEFRKNPALIVPDLQNLVAKFSGEKKYEPTRNEVSLAMYMADPQVPGFDSWILYQLKKMRARLWGEGDQNWMYKLPTGELEPLGNLQHTFRYIRDWAMQTQAQIASYNFETALRHAQEWHTSLVVSSEDQTLQYQEKNVVFTLSNGWTIQEVRSENDLGVEGEKMGHCVGGYCEIVARGDSSIYSLRDPKNEPHATIEVRPTAKGEPGPATPMPSKEEGWEIIQIQGKENKEPIPEYKKMIAEWFKSLDRENISMSDSEDDLQEQISYTPADEWADVIWNSYPHENEYGISQGKPLEKISAKQISNIASIIIGSLEGRSLRNYRVDQAMEALADLSWDSDIAKIKHYYLIFHQPIVSNIEALQNTLLEYENSITEFLDEDTPPPYPEDYESESEFEDAVERYEKYRAEVFSELPVGAAITAVYDRWTSRKKEIGNQYPSELVSMLEKRETKDEALKFLNTPSQPGVA